MCNNTDNNRKNNNGNNESGPAATRNINKKNEKNNDVSTPSKSTTTTTTTPDYMPNVDFEAIADRCLVLLKQCQDDNHDASSSQFGFNKYKQVFVGIVGTPGSGKSYIAEQIAKIINNERYPNGCDQRSDY